jgi:single-strand DNA-binding protein
MATRTAKKPVPVPTAKGPVVTKTGNLTSDPELRFAESTGKAYCRMRIGVSTPVKPGDWTGERRTDFYDVTAFGTLAENAAESLEKGDRILVTGQGEVRSWTGDNGVEHKGKVIVADALGPDLRWAMASVVRTTRARPVARSDAEAGEEDGEEPF